MLVCGNGLGDLDTNKSCGLHVHVGIFSTEKSLSSLENDNLSFIKQLVLNWMALEKNGLSFPERAFKIRRFTSSNEVENNKITKDLIAAKDIEGMKNALCQRGRMYEPINLFSLVKHGTIEFRSHPGTINPRDIAAWTRFIDNLVGVSLEALQENPNPHFPQEVELEKLEEMLKELKEYDSCVIGNNVSYSSRAPSPSFTNTEEYRRVVSQNSSDITTQFSI